MLRLEGLSCGYGPMRVVHGLDLDLPGGEVMALVGANGAGKTSTLMAVAGHVAIHEGGVRIGGEDFTRRPATARVAAGCALVPEGRRLFAELSVDENLTVGGYALPRARDARNRVQVFELFPQLGPLRRRRAGLLSGGEQQMLAIGRALMAEPRLLLIDEVSLGLMPRNVDVCFDALGRLRADGMTILLVEQSTRRALALADRVCVLESGRVAYRGSGDEARASPGLVEAYLGGAAAAAEADTGA